MNRIIATLLVAILATSSITPAFAHGGRTDKNGCHQDRKTGTRHCH